MIFISYLFFVKHQSMYLPLNVSLLKFCTTLFFRESFLSDLRCSKMPSGIIDMLLFERSNAVHEVLLLMRSIGMDARLQFEQSTVVSNSRQHFNPSECTVRTNRHNRFCNIFMIKHRYCTK